MVITSDHWGIICPSENWSKMTRIRATSNNEYRRRA